MIFGSLNESIVKEAILTRFGELVNTIGYRQHMAYDDPTHDWGDDFGLPPRISIGCFPNLDLSPLNASGSLYVAPTGNYHVIPGMFGKTAWL